MGCHIYAGHVIVGGGGVWGGLSADTQSIAISLGESMNLCLLQAWDKPHGERSLRTVVKSRAYKGGLNDALETRYLL